MTNKEIKYLTLQQMKSYAHEFDVADVRSMTEKELAILVNRIAEEALDAGAKIARLRDAVPEDKWVF